jgi:cytochrome c
VKSPFHYQQVFILLVVLALAQFACGLGAQPSTASPQQTSPGVPQPSQSPPTGSFARGTPDEAMAMLQKAVEHYNSVGRAQALADFNGRVAPFFDRDLYVACIDSHLIQSANGGYPNLVGSSLQPLSRAAWDSASSNQVGSVHYQWLNPASKKTEPKTFYFEKVGSDVCGVGAYHP